MDTTENLKSKIERFIGAYDGTYIGQCVKNRYDNSDGSFDSLQSIVEYIDES